MIVVHVQLRSKPERRAETVSALRQMQQSTRDNDAGCLRYAFSVDLDDDCLFACVEEWSDMASLRAHLAADHMAGPDAALGETLAAPADIRVFEASAVSL
ncbi:MAG: putative quinol monooxygenase [Stackebrandtia sp.]